MLQIVTFAALGSNEGGFSVFLGISVFVIGLDTLLHKSLVFKTLYDCSRCVFSLVQDLMTAFISKFELFL